MNNQLDVLQLVEGVDKFIFPPINTEYSPFFSKEGVILVERVEMIRYLKLTGWEYTLTSIATNNLKNQVPCHYFTRPAKDFETHLFVQVDGLRHKIVLP